MARPSDEHSKDPQFHIVSMINICSTYTKLTQRIVAVDFVVKDLLELAKTQEKLDFKSK